MRLPIFITSSSGTARWSPRTVGELGPDFDETYLERRIEERPELLGLEDRDAHIAGPFRAFRQLVLETPTGQIAKPDLVFLTHSGHVVVVEVKLESNRELWGREVVAQVLDYAASLSTYEEQDLVKLFAPELPARARFVDVVRRLFPQDDAAAISEALLRRLRGADIQVVIACDRAPDELNDYVKAVSAQRALGAYAIRVVEVVPYIRDGAGASEVMLVPGAITKTEIVMRTSIEVVNRPDGKVSVNVETTPLADLEEKISIATGAKRAPRPELLAAADAYESVAEPGTSVFGRAADHRKIRVEGWPTDIHYEFLFRRSPEDSIRVELHFESAEFVELAKKVQAAARAAPDAPPGLMWDPQWIEGGRLGIVLPIAADPRRFAGAMVALIKLTRPLVAKALRR
jgi:hypothetical protein